MQSVARAFLDAADRQRSSSALVTPERTWSYEDLARLTGAVSSYIGQAGLERGSRVALLLHNSAEYVAAYFGAQMAGCSVVALNIQEPPQVLSRLIEHCDAKLLFADPLLRGFSKLKDLLGRAGPKVVAVSEQSHEWQQIVESSFPDFRYYIVDTRAGDLASIIYTSGTTGDPKGVMLSHRNLCANTESILEYLDISWVDRTFNVLPLYYSFGNSIMLTHMAVGACLILQNNVAFPHAVLKRMSEEKSTGFYGVPTTFTLLFDPDRIASVDLSSLRYIAQAGGPMPVFRQQQLMRSLPRVKIFVMYGQTEATARLTYLDPDRLPDKAGSVGKAIPGVEIRVGHNLGEHHSADAPGEVYARGSNIMMGYWNNSTASSEVLRDGWLRTGDLGYFDDEGFLYLTGRSSEMIKTGANRVSPTEIEDVVRGCNGVCDVGAYAVDDEVLGEAIAVAIVPDGVEHLDHQEIRRHCLRGMSAYKVPKYIRFVESLPRTSSGKLKRHILKKEHEESVEHDIK